MSDDQVILAIDQGTTSCRAMLVDRSGHVRNTAQREFTQYYPQSGWVNHDASEIWNVTLSVAREALADAAIDLNRIAGIGITNQRETTVLWDRTTGEPVVPAIVWQSRQSAPM